MTKEPRMPNLKVLKVAFKRSSLIILSFDNTHKKSQRIGIIRDKNNKTVRKIKGKKKFFLKKSEVILKYFVINFYKHFLM